MLEMKDIIFKFLNQIATDIKNEQSSQGRVASGKTAQSLEPEATDNVGILYGNISVNVLETGRKGGNVPARFKDIIFQWMQDKGIFQAETESKQRSIAFLIARKIKESGTLLHRQGGNSGVLSNVITDEKISVFEREVLSRYGREVTEEIVTTFAK